MTDQVRWWTRREGVTEFELLTRDDRIALRADLRAWLAGDDADQIAHDAFVDQLVMRHRGNLPLLERRLQVLEDRLPAAMNRSLQADRAFNRDSVLMAATLAGLAAGAVLPATVPMRAALAAAKGPAPRLFINTGLTYLMEVDTETGPGHMRDLVTDLAVGSTLQKVELIVIAAPDSAAAMGVLRSVDAIAPVVSTTFELMELYVTWTIRRDHREALERLTTDIERVREALRCLQDESQECVEAVRRNLSAAVRDLAGFVDERGIPILSGTALTRSVVDEVVRRVAQVVSDKAGDLVGARSRPEGGHVAVGRVEADGVVSSLAQGAPALVQFDQGRALALINAELARIMGAFGTLEVLPVAGRDLRERFRLRCDFRREVLGAMAAVAATVEVAPQWDVPDADVAYDVVVFKADARVEQRGLYEGAIEYGYDRDRAYEAAGGVVRVQDMFDLELFFIAPSTTGFVAVFRLGLGSRLPVTIPVGATGFALKRVRGHFAHNFTARLGVGTTEGGAADPTENLTAEDVAAWIRRNDADPFQAWERIDEGRGYAGGFGLSADFVTLPDSGFLVTLEDLGFGYFSEGPVVYLHGSGRLLDAASLTITATALILPSSSTIDMSATADLHVPSAEGGRDAFKIVSARGGARFRASLGNPRSWFVHLGHRDRPIRGTLFQNLLTAETYVMVDHSAIETGGRVHAGRSMRLGPFGLSGQFGMAVESRLGWSPIQVSTGVEVLGALSACLWRWCLGLGLGAQISAALVRPTALEVRGHVSLRLPFRRRSISASGVILRYSYPSTDEEREAHGAKPVVVAPLQLLDDAGITNAASGGSMIRAPGRELVEEGRDHAGEGHELAGEGRAVLGAFHRLTGKQWALPPGASDAIWPDAELVIPFIQRVGCRVGEQPCAEHRPHDPDQVWIVNPQPDTPVRSGGYSVTHRLTRLQVEELDAEGKRQPVRCLDAGWAAIDGEPGGTTHRLHLPMRTPFDWLNPFPTLRDLARHTVERSTVIGFGTGDVEIVRAPVTVGSIVVLPSETARNEWPNRLAPRSFAPVRAAAGLTPAEADELEHMMDGRTSTRALIAARGHESVQIRLGFALVDDDGTPVRVTDAVLVITSGVPLDPETTLQAATVHADGTSARLDAWFVGFNDDLDAGEPGHASTVHVAAPDRGTFDHLTLTLSYREEFEVEVVAVVLRHQALEALGGDDPAPWRPGRYELSIAGTTTVQGHGLDPHSHAWTHSQPFEVVPIPTLRPYVFDTTLGDSRLFRGETEPWNPTPFGLGFPTYRKHLGVVRLRSSRVDHLATFRAPSDTDGEAAVRVEVDGREVEPSFRPTAEWPVPAAVQAWLRNHGRPDATGARAGPQPPQELVFVPLTDHLPPGATSSSTVTIVRAWQAADGTRASTKLDEWHVAVSRFDGIEDHLRLPHPLTVVDTAYSHRGRARLRPPSPLSLVFGDDDQQPPLEAARATAEAVDALLEHGDRPERSLLAEDVPHGWRLDEGLTRIVRGPDGDGALGSWSALGFVRAAHWAGIRLGTGAPMAGLLEAPRETEIAFVKTPSGGERPLMLWLRTPEPIDWRRIQASITVAPLRARDGAPAGTYRDASFERLRFAVDALPSPDGSSALLFMRTPTGDRGRSYVLWPQGLYRLTLRYAFVLDDVTRLPWLHPRGDDEGRDREPRRSQDVHLRLVLVSGEPWPGASGPVAAVGGRHA